MTEQTLRRILLGVLMVAVMLIAGCGGDKGVRDDEGAYPATENAQDANRSSSGLDSEALNARGLKGVNEDDRSMFTDPNNPLSKRLVYFDFDSDTVKPEYMAVLKAHADYAIKHGKTIRLEGHTDERGTREYNIGLSQRRAEAVRRVMMLDGMSKSNLPILAFGEERPAALGHDEAAWAKNRRVELIYVD